MLTDFGLAASSACGTGHGRFRVDLFFWEIERRPPPIWSMNLESGNPRVIANAANPQISSDGKFLFVNSKLPAGRRFGHSAGEGFIEAREVRVSKSLADCTSGSKCPW